MPRRRKRLDPGSFNLPVDRLKLAVASDPGVTRLRTIIRAAGPSPQAVIQVGAERACVLGGTDEVISLLKLSVDDWSALNVHALYDGDHVEAGETVMTIEGPYDAFAPLEPLLLGTLARRTRVSTNARAFVEAARPKLVFAFPARHDHWLLEAGDALAAQIGGALVLASDPTISSLSSPPPKAAALVPPLTVVPHAAIGAYGGDTLAAVRAFATHAAGGDTAAAGESSSVHLVVPVDYDNDAVRTALDVARALEGRLWGVQLATSENLVDASIIPLMGTFPPTGVNATLVWNVRNALDAEGFGDVKILAASGITLEQIRQFEEEGVPVDAYGMGAALLAGRTGFTAALVQLDRSLRLRVGSELRPSARLEKVR